MRLRRSGFVAHRAAGLALLLVAALAPEAGAVVVATDPPARVGWNSAVVGGTIYPQGVDTDWLVEYGLTTSYNRFEGFETFPASEPPGPVTALLTGLAADTTYHYRLAATSPAANGQDRTFTTLAPHPAGFAAAAAVTDQLSLTGAEYQSRPDGLVTAAALSGLFPGFPLDSASYLALSTGAIDDVAEPASDQATTVSSDAGGAVIPARGPSARDVTVVQLGLEAPSWASCLCFAFRFFTEETPSAGVAFRDSFIAEIDASTWTTSASALSAPLNIAYGALGQVVSVNGLADAPTTQAAAAGTPFDWATPTLRASAAITPGSHTLYLSLFDQGDDWRDSAVVVDRLQFSAGACMTGAVDDSLPLGPPPAPAPAPAPTVTIVNEPLTRDPDPVLGASVIGYETEGRVLVTPRGGSPSRLADAARVPFGSKIDARKGRVRLRAAGGPGAGTQVGSFEGGLFTVAQDRRVPFTTELRLSESLPRCRRGSKGRTRRLWSETSGRFRVAGRHASATVPSGRWLVQDSCSGTLVRVERGRAEVRDLARKRTATLRAVSRRLVRPRK
jgi:hypothetical protein